MAAIRVNLKTLLGFPEGIQSYCSYQDAQMRQADFEVKSMLCSDWLGPDAKEFEGKWAGVCDRDSQAAKFKHSLVEFGEILEACAKEYRAAQRSATDGALALLGSINVGL